MASLFERREDAARAAFEAYGASTGGLTYDGRPIPAWEDLTERIRDAWRAGAEAVLSLVIQGEAGIKPEACPHCLAMADRPPRVKGHPGECDAPPGFVDGAGV